MQIERHLGSCQRRKAKMVVERMKQFQVQQRQAIALGSKAAHEAANAVFIGFRPAIAALDDGDTIRPQQVQLAQRAADYERLDIGIARQKQMAVQRFEEIRARLAPVRLSHQ